MDLKLINKNAIVCASSQGLGKAAAIDLALEGVNLAICSRDQKKIDKTKDEIIERTENKVKVFAYKADLNLPNDIKKFYEEATNNLGSIDILVNNTGGPPPSKFEELTDEVCKWPINHPNESNFYFCGRTSLKNFSYCKLHLLYNFQPKNKKENILDKDDEVPQFIEKKIKSA